MSTRLSLPLRLVLMVVVGMAAVLGVFSIAALMAIQESTDRALKERLALAQATASQVDYVLQENLRMLHNAAFTQAQGVAGGKLEGFRTILHQTYLSSVFNGGVSWVEADGSVALAEPPASTSQGENIASLPHVQAALNTGHPTISNLYVEPLTGQFIVSAVAPIWGPGGRAVGLMVGDIDLATSRLQEVVRTAGLGATGYMQVVDSAGRVLASTIPRYMFTESDHGQRIASLIAEKRTAVGTCHDCHDPATERPPQDEVMAFAPLTMAPWGVVLREPESEALTAAHTLRRQFLIFGGALLALGIALAWAVGQSLARPLGFLTRAAQRIAAGDLTQGVPNLGRDEVGRLARAFNTMRGRLKGSLDQLEGWSRELEARVEERTRELADSRDHLEASLAENVRLYEELQRREALRGEFLARVINAQEEERKRIARELHDETSQTLTALAMALETAAQAPDSKEAQRRLAEMKGLAQDLLAGVHRLIFDLRPSLLDDLGLIPAVRWYAESKLEPLGLRFLTEVEGIERRLDPRVEAALFRILQEALNNIARHAKAQNVVITFTFAADRLSIEVEDDGEGFDVSEVEGATDRTRGLGLLGMRERASLLGGSLRIESQPGAGTVIQVLVPLEGGGGDEQGAGSNR